METVYGDIYFAVNFSMDFLALLICCKLLRLEQRTLRMCLSAATGALYAVVTLAFHGRSSLISVICSVLLPFLMIYIAFGYGRMGQFIKVSALFWNVSFVMGGAMTAIYYLAGRLGAGKLISVGGVTHVLYNDMPLWVFFLIVPLCALGASLWNRIAGRRSTVKSARLEIYDKGVSICVDALCDSGNLLTEPLGGRSVIFLAKPLMKKLLPSVEHWGKDEFWQGADAKRIRIVPYSTVDSTGILCAYLPDAIKVNGILVSACVCAAPALDKSKAPYEAIVPACLI